MAALDLPGQAAPRWPSIRRDVTRRRPRRGVCCRDRQVHRGQRRADVAQPNLLRNNLDSASPKSLVEIAKTKRISLCGITPDQTTVSFAFWGLMSLDAILLASDLSITSVSGALTEVHAFLNLGRVGLACFLSHHP